MKFVLAPALIGVCGILIYLLRITDDQLLQRFAAAKRQDRPLKNSWFFAVIAALIGVEFLVFSQLDIPLELYLPVIALSAYLPLTFFFYCNVFLIGNRRELIWTCIFIVLCILSLLFFGWLQLGFILSVSVLGTVVLCWLASKDSYTHYRRGLRYLDTPGRTEDAMAAFERAWQMNADDSRFLYHIGRCRILLGRSRCGQGQEAVTLVEQGQRMIDEILQRDPDFIQRMREDPLFRNEWLVGEAELAEKAHGDNVT